MRWAGGEKGLNVLFLVYPDVGPQDLLLIFVYQSYPPGRNEAPSYFPPRSGSHEKFYWLPLVMFMRL